MKTTSARSASKRATATSERDSRTDDRADALVDALPDGERDVPWLDDTSSTFLERGAGSRRPGRKAGSSSSTTRSRRRTGLLSESELRVLEERHESGITAVEVVELFTSRGVRLSEATFRKYVQQGLVPRSKRIGRKGKHRGSLGVYPAKTVRRINTIKERMEEGFTIEEIQEHFLRFTDLVEGVEESLTDLFEGMGQAIEGPRFDARAKKTLSKELKEAKRLADELLGRVSELAETVAEPPSDRYRGSGAAGSAEELL